jgi:hypothetical protein
VEEISTEPRSGDFAPWPNTAALGGITDQASFSAAESPAKAAWIVAHQDLLRFFEPSASWSVDASKFWALFDANRSAPWAEALAWTAAQKLPGADECGADCHLDMIQFGPQKYWTLFPNGPHIGAALARADSMARDGIASVSEDAPTRPRIDSVRASLRQVTAPQKAHLIDLLDQLERFVKRE